MKRLILIALSIGIYLLLLMAPGFSLLAKPIELLATFLHEFGHAFFALISGGSVHSLCVNMDGSGVTTTSGGSLGLITMGGYVGSAVFGNIMIRLSKDSTASLALKSLGTIMLVSSFFWFDNITTSGLLTSFSISLLAISHWGSKEISSFMLSFLGVACVLYIIQDFNVGPTSDLQAYESEVGIFPASVWMYIWLVLVIVITAFNLKTLIKIKNEHIKK